MDAGDCEKIILEFVKSHLLFYSFNCESVHNTVTIKFKKQESILPVISLSVYQLHKSRNNFGTWGYKKSSRYEGDIYPVVGSYPENWSIPF